jgi:uncharacterized phage protein (TIGR01671 family)
MGREIKFRAWDKRNNKWFHQDLFIMTNAGFYSDYREFEDGNSLFDYEYQLLQYTGLKDKNGKDIYEGDILEFNSIVTWVDGSDPANLGMEVGFYAQRDNFESWRLIEVGEELEVLGNIFENPELISK